MKTDKRNHFRKKLLYVFEWINDMPIKRKISKSRYLHICQKSADNGLIFNVIEDFVVLFTILCVKAVSYDVSILAIGIMFNHFHLGGYFANKQVLAAFMNSSTSVYARLYNQRYHLKGQLFRRPFKSSPKKNEKKIRENLFYIWNNPVEKKAVKNAEDYRWNFMGYMESDHPFSKMLVESEASAELLRLIGKVKAKHKLGKYLGYRFFDGDYQRLSSIEKAQLIDYIIVTYGVINNVSVLKRFGSYDSMVLAAHSVSGAEYDLEDDMDEEDYRHYRQMISISSREGFNLRSMRFNREFFVQNEDAFRRLYRMFRDEVGATDYEIAKFFHLLK